jgi:transcriptional antiterminator RfaH
VSIFAQPNQSRWFAIQTKPAQESRAEANLSAWGVQTFSPKHLERSINPFSGKPSFCAKPLFPRYLFARFDPELYYHKVSFTRGVNKIVSFGAAPLAVSDETIQMIQDRVAADGYVQIGEEFEPGDVVRIKQGSLRGVSGVFDARLKDSDRVKILLTSINYQASVTLERQNLERVVLAA